MTFIQNRMRNTIRLALVSGALAFLLLFMNGTGAQQTPQPQQRSTTQPPQAKPSPQEKDDGEYEVLRTTSNLVVVPVSVTDATGQPVLGLAKGDFRLEEEGRAQEIAQIGDPEQVPLEIALLIDVSGSVDARFAFEQQAAARFLKQVLKPVDRAAIYAIDQTPRLVQTRDTAETASAKLMTIGPAKGPTAFYDAIINASKYLTQNTPSQHRRVIVVISDGEDNFSDRIRETAIAEAQDKADEAQDKTSSEAARKAQQMLRRKATLEGHHRKALLEVQREVQKAEAAFYSINPSGEALKLNVISKRAQEGMEQLASATGGTSFVPEKLEDLDSVFRQVAAELRSQYLLQYYSNDDSPSGKFLRISVRAPARPQLRIRARQGYYTKRK